MAQTAVNIQKMKSVSADLDKIYGDIHKQLQKMDEHMGTLEQLWRGEAAQAYQKAYLSKTDGFLRLAESVKACSQTLSGIAGAYQKADIAASEAIKAKMGGAR